MTNHHENPCAACSTNHGCCTLKGACGLMLTKEEFDTHFKGHTDKLVVRSSGKFVIISSGEGWSCPHLDAGGCRIYHDRPIDCRLFPYMMSNIFDKRTHLRVVFHTRSDCPQKNHLLQPHDEAKALVIKFARTVFGPDRPIIADFEKNRTFFSRARNFIDRKRSERHTKSVS